MIEEENSSPRSETQSTKKQIYGSLNIANLNKEVVSVESRIPDQKMKKSDFLHINKHARQIFDTTDDLNHRDTLRKIFGSRNLTELYSSERENAFYSHSGHSVDSMKSLQGLLM